MRLTSRCAGFSIVEVVVASAVLLLTCVAVAGTLTTVLRAERVVRQRSALEEVLGAECARLAALPFFASATHEPGDAASDIRPASLLAVVFPHARSDLNAPDAYYCDAGGAGAPGAFVTQADADGVILRREARLVVGAGTHWEAVPPAALRGWAIWDDARVPASTLEIALSARSGQCVVSRTLMVRALPARVAPSPTSVEEGDPSG